MSPAKRTAFECVTPILRVKSVTRSIDYYERKLGFRLDWRGPIFASVSRGKSAIFLSEGDQGHAGAWVWVGVSDCDAMLKEYRRTKAKIRHLPANYSWAYEMQVEDLDGNVLRMGSEPKAGKPIGEWLDMRGRRWAFTPERGWSRASAKKKR
jgi:catechol 2,3-dioxygenase-like lactoylglutathione lyase family enzyme